ncbi:caspase family protein [Duganella vulcania]|uniref:Peptidase C14 caspase domain-containing protein n=1 Tax=Duganella vulcania TaxID=2692166 RepID=A0A845GW78_9BURK|nr:caspase family protein [Duganella vulcania]MYM97582.1 hypothetical protein [Duganella vulcania]
MRSDYKIAASIILLASTAMPAVMTRAAPAPAPKSYALLVGVDQYAQPTDMAYQISNLRGPANDVAEIKALLTDKYAFSGADIVTLIGKQATVAAIEANFKSHLLDNAKKNPGARIVFYVSGHGSTSQDRNGDESDGVDETLVAHDSRTTGKSDILDDQIEQWLKSLAPYTSNVTVIFDSCHSGDGTRALGLTARGVPPNHNTDPHGVQYKRSKDGAERVGTLRGRNGYAFISGARAGELSNEGAILDENGQAQYRGFLTHYLVAALRQDPTLTYEEVVHRIGPQIARLAPSQHPQAQGDVLRRFLGTPGDQQKPYIKIANTPVGNRFTVEAGAIHGVGVGALLAVYASDTEKLVGETGKIANAQVVTATMNTADVELLGNPSRAVTRDDKVTLVTPAKASERTPVLLSGLAQQKATSQDLKVLAGIKELLKDDYGVIAAPSDKDWALSVQRGCMTGTVLTPSSREAAMPAATCKPVYYVAPRDNRDRVLADLIVDEASTSDAATRLARYISLKARQDNLRRVENLQSPLQGKLRISLVKMTQVDGKTIETEYSAAAGPRLAVGDKYQARISNASDQDLYVALLVLGSSGDTFLYSPSGNGELVLKNTAFKVGPVFTAGKPYGLETYKLFASLRPDVDYRVLESMGTKTLTGDTSVFGRLLADYSNSDTRNPDAATQAALNLDQWVTHSIDVEIVK